ncbi:hypothetical protein BJ741DRAFT_585750 [Chytriomyces cf. hyalinus JEL632]|nr:hypothetical protein BJ741DRAFT_585750 [Chytriomyces cf. hyalinus JEL632]
MEEYLARLRWTGPMPPPPTLDTLSQIVALHTHVFTFGNVGMFTGADQSVDEATLMSIVRSGSSGIGLCFQHHSLMLKVLRDIGFEAVPLLARVKWNGNIVSTATSETGLVHVAIRVFCEEKNYLVDVAFGSMCATIPLVLERESASTPQRTLLEWRRFQFGEGGFTHQCSFDGVQWHDLYSVVSLDVVPNDLVVGAWFVATYPKGKFFNNLIVSRIFGDECRKTIENLVYTVRYADGRRDRRVLSSQAELVAVLNQEFGYDLEHDTVLRVPAVTQSLGE